MNGDPKVYQTLLELNIPFKYVAHPPAPTIDIAMQYWKEHDAQHCKNLFFRNHKGDRHYLVILDCLKIMSIHDIEKMLKQGKLTFASENRMNKYLGLKPGSVSPFGLINDTEKNVHVFIDINLKKAEKISFHPNENTASLIINFDDFIRFLNFTGNIYEFLELY
ncbi:MAG: prolyl-tRNA synthetase associated domain-containing protein [Bacteroidales bacterium]|nr:prolyl-tRNA synthetase associated domain-containing protein [Bacteroidales bacterium]